MLHKLKLPFESICTRNGTNENHSISQAIIFTVLLALGLVSGGIPSATNAADLQEHYLDSSACDSLENYRDNPAYSLIEETCDNLEQIRDSQIASAVSSIIYI